MYFSIYSIVQYIHIYMYLTLAIDLGVYHVVPILYFWRKVCTLGRTTWSL